MSWTESDGRTIDELTFIVSDEGDADTTSDDDEGEEDGLEDE